MAFSKLYPPFRIEPVKDCWSTPRPTKPWPRGRDPRRNRDDWPRPSRRFKTREKYLLYK